MSGIKSGFCNNILCKLWDNCITVKLWISAAHISGVSNKETDKNSRTFDDAKDWQLNSRVILGNL